MPGFVLEEPFPLARFQNTINSTENKPFIIGLNGLEQASSIDNNEEESDLVAITVQGEGFKLYNTTNQKCVKSWTTPPGVNFSGPVIHRDGGQDPNAFDYTYAIVSSGPDITKAEENKTIWVWKSSKNNNNEEEDKTKKILEERISAIHLSPTLLSHVIIVNASGSVELATNDLDRLTAKQKTTNKDGDVVWSSVFVTSNHRACCIPSSMVPAGATMVITVTHQHADLYTVKLNFVNVERRSIENVAKMELNLTERPVAFTFDAMDGKMTILGAEGTWTVWRLLLKHSSSKKVMGQLREHLAIKLKGYDLDSAAISQVSENYVAMMATRGKEHVMSVWEIKYGTLQAEQVIKTSEKTLQNSSSPVYNMTVLSNSHIAFTVSTILEAKTKTKKKVMSTQSVVMLCPFYSEPVSLMAAMGKMKSTVAFMGIDDGVKSTENIGFSRCGYDVVAYDMPLEPKPDVNVYQEWVQNLENRQRDQDRGLAKLLDASISQQDFTEVFFKFVHVDNSVNVDVPMKDDIALFKKADQYRELMNTKWAKNKNASKSNELSQFFVSAIVGKCFQADNLEFWPVDVVLFLMSRSLLRNSYVEKGLVSSFIEREEWALLPIVLEKVTDIPENDMILIIKKLIQAKKEEEDTFLSFLTLIANTPKNDIFLQQAFKSINTSELPGIIAGLIKLFQDKSITHGKRSNLIDFTNALVDIHFPALIMEPSLHESVTVLRQLMESELQVVEELEQLRSVLGAYDRKRNHDLVKQNLMKSSQSNNADAPRDELTRYRKKNKDKFGGEQGIPAYRVEVFRF